MTQENNSTAPSNHPAPYVKPMLLGGSIGLMLISLFVFGVDNANPEWGKFWMIKPFLLTPLAGAMGGLFYYLMNYASSNYGVNKALSIIIGLVGFLVALWLGVVLGLNGTMWD
jgi:hypothetical protein